MVLEEMIIENLYGFMNKTVKFNDGISILVGINGSGKTSVLNLINWMLKPSFPDLCQTEFKKISLKFSYENESYLLVCEQNDIELLVNLSNLTKNKSYNSINVAFVIHPKRITKDESLKEQVDNEYNHLVPEDHEIETWGFLFNILPKPVIIGLDRYIYTEEGSSVRIQDEKLFSTSGKIIKRKQNVSSPIDNVVSILNKEYNNYRNVVLKLYGSLNEKIMLSAFDDIITSKNIMKWLSRTRPTIDKINLLEKQVIDFLKENNWIKQDNTDNISANKIKNYFVSLRSILRSDNKSDENYELVLLANVSQFKKINDLIAEFSQFEDETKKLYNQLKLFLDTVNHFFKDSSKELYFNKETSEIKFNLLNKDLKIIETERRLTNLSSGEKQILILLTYLRYNNNQNVLIIDEPELSLHPKWQGDFLDAVHKLMPGESQLIIATHSPEILGDNKEFCSVLFPYN
jgi:predicted ATP-dependent endonuclease of OLD family